MSATAILTVVLLQGAEVTASVDRTRLTVGEEVLVTVRARTRSAERVELLLPPLAGFAIAGSRELTEVSMSGTGGPLRTTVRELRLRAEQAGALLIGPVRARQGASVVSTDPILVTVDSAATRGAIALSPLARELLESAPSPAPRLADQVALTIIAPDDTVLAGQQVDLIAAAWVPRDLRIRMRAPVLTLTTPEGVWAYPPSAPAAVATSRQVGESWMDVFIVHQIMFPLAPGRVVVPPAAVDYAVPVSFSLFSREERFTLRTDSVTIVVLPLPAAGRPTDDLSVVGRGITLDLRVTPVVTRVGEPLDVAVTVAGAGNVSLWPEPALRWPPGFRVYPAETEVRLAPAGGRIAGTKTFHYLVVPDSSGRFVLPEARYPFFDIGTGRYAAAEAAPRALAVAAGTEPRAARSLPPLLPARGAGAGWVDRVGRRLPPAGWLALLLGPPLGAWALRRRRRVRGRDEETGEERGARMDRTHLGHLEHAFYGVLASHVPDAFARDGDGLAPALRAAGIESAVADHVRRLRDRLRAARYGPRGLGDAAELAAEIEQVLAVLGGASGAGLRGGRRRSLTALGLILVAAVSPARGQGASAEALYEAAALRAAADSFAARAAADPAEAAHWYNLGAALYRAGADGKAIAAWTAAARLAPRDPVLRRARRLLTPPDLVSERLLAVGWATPEEWGLLAGAAWVVLWVAAAGRPSKVWLAVLAAVSVGAGLAGAREARRRAQPVAVVTTEGAGAGAGAAVRAAPYGGATAAATIPPGGAALVRRSYGAWIEVSRADGIRGWVLAADVARP